MRHLVHDTLFFAANKVFPAFILSCSLAASLAQAAPQGGVIVGGQGSISTTTNTTSVNQQTGSMVVDWSSFNVNSNETVNFIQPSSSAAVLNRIYDQNPSQIFGAINANGRVFLSNPNGMIFGQTATVNVGALIATGLTISKDDFMNGNYQFNADGYTPGAIINHGLLAAASGGSISLIGGQVVNDGYIVADYGQINLATGKQAVLNFDGDGLINIQVSENILTNLNDAESSVLNAGSLQANGGKILLDAHVAKDVFTNAVNNEGVITAHRMENRGGEVYLFGNSGTTIHSGVIDVYGETAEGGSVLLLGDRVGLFGEASVDASGVGGGGEILIGGDFQGNNSAIQNAEYTYVSEKSSIKADSVKQGDGGKVIVWADNTTRFYGDISAKGGALSGNGGFAEISGKQGLVKKGMVDLTAANGETGTLLLDPGVITIKLPGNNDGSDAGNTDKNILNNDPGSVTDGQIAFADIGTTAGTAADPFIVTKSEIENQSSSANIILQATDAINVSGSGTVTLVANNLTMQTRNATGDAATGIDLTNVEFVTQGGGTITLKTGVGDNTSAPIITGKLTTAGGSITIESEGSIDITDTVVTNGGNFSSTATDPLGAAIKINAAIDAGAGAVTISTTGAITQFGGSVKASSLTTSSANGTTLGGSNAVTAFSANNTASGFVVLNNASGGTLDLQGVTNTGRDINITDNGNISVSGSVDGATVTLNNTGGSITQTASGAITASVLLDTRSVDGTTLTAATNMVEAFTASNTGSGDVLLDNDTAGGTLDVQAISNVVGAINITEVDAISISGAQSGTTVTLDAGDIVTQTASGVITASVLLDTRSVGGTTLTAATNVVEAFTASNIGSGDVRLKNDTAGGTLDVQAISNAVGAINIIEADAISVSGAQSGTTVTLDAGGSITQSASGTITASTLTTISTTGSTTLTADNAVSTYNGTATGANNTLSFTNKSGVLNISGITADGDVTLISDQLAINSAVIAAGKKVTLQTATADTKIDVGGSAGLIGALELTSAELNLITAGTISIVDATSGEIVVSSVIAAATDLHLTTGGTVTGTGAITGGQGLAITAGGAVTLNGSNDVSTLAIAAGSNDASFVDINDLSVGVVDSVTGISAGNVNLTAIDMDITASVAAVAVDGVVELQQAGGNTINLGVDSGALNTLELTQADIANITGETLRIGNINAGAINISAIITPATNNLHLFTGTGIPSNIGNISGNKNLAVTSLGDVAMNAFAADVATLAISATGQTITFADTNDVIIGDVDGVSGLVADTVDLDAVGSVSGASTITAQNLAIDAASINLTSTATDVDTVALNAAGSVSFIDANNLTVGSVAGTTGINSGALNLNVNSGLLTVTDSIAATADVLLKADKMAINNTLTASGKRVTLESVVAGNQIDLGSSTDTATNTLELSDMEIDNIVSGTLVIGDAASGNIIFSDIISPQQLSDNLHLISGGNIESTGSGGLLFTSFTTGVALEALGANSSITFNDPNTNVRVLAANVTQDINFINAGDLTISTIDGVIDMQGNNITLTTPLRLSIPIGITATNDITLTTRDPQLGKIEGTGALLIQPYANGAAIDIGTGSGNDFQISNGTFSNIQPGFASVTIGNVSAGDVNIRDAMFNDSLTIIGGNMTINSLNVFTTNDVTLNSTGFIRGLNTGNTNIVANNANLIAASGGIGESLNYLKVSATSSISADTSADNGDIFINSTGNLPLALINAGSGNVILTSDMMITDANNSSNNIFANIVFLQANDGIGAGGAESQIETDANQITLVNNVAGDIDVLEANNVVLFDLFSENGDVTLLTTDGLIIKDGSIIQTVSGGGISLFAGSGIAGDGAFTVNSAGDFTFNQAITADGAVSIKTVDPMNITENITTTVGAITLDSPSIAFSPGVVLTAASSIDILNATSTGSGDLTLIATGIDLLNALTVTNGNLLLNSGNDDLSIASAVTVNGGDLTINTAELDIALTGSIVGSDTVTISDNGSGMELGGTADPNKLNITVNEYDQITAGNLVLSTQNTLTLKSTFQPATSVSPLTINADQLNVSQVAGIVLSLSGDLDISNTPVVAAADFTIKTGGAFSMNNTIETTGAFTLTADLGVTMGEPSSITSNNGQIDITTNGGDLLLGLANAGTGNVNLTATAGSVLNNNGVFSDITKSQININATSTTITASQRIGASSTDAITINASPAGLITLDFNAEKAFINNLQNTRILNLGSGDVAVGLIFSGQIIGVGHSVGLNSTETEEVPADTQNEDSMLSVLGADYKLSAVDEEEEDSSTLNTVVPVMIRTKDGWEFKAPLRAPANQKGQERKVDWL